MAPSGAYAQRCLLSRATNSIKPLLSKPDSPPGLQLHGAINTGVVVTLCCAERVIDVGDNIVRMFDADRKPDIPIADAGLQLLFR